MSDQSVNERRTRDNTMLEQLAAADGALIRFMTEARHQDMTGVSEGSCFSGDDIVELKDAHLRLTLVLQRAEATRGLQDRRREVERTDP